MVQLNGFLNLFGGLEKICKCLPFKVMMVVLVLPASVHLFGQKIVLTSIFVMGR